VKACGQEFSSDILERIQQTLDEEPALPRWVLSRMVCGWLNWRTALGQLKEVSCRVALLKLHRRGLLRLPEIDQRSIPRPERVRTEPPRLEPAAVESSLEALQPVSLLRIDSADSPHSRIWNELMNQEHYLGAEPLCGV
jgi:hypothetical protein